MTKKILVVNKFYYSRGGDCMYAMASERLLTDHGHKVAVFAMDYPENIETEWNGYYASEVRFSGGLSNLLKSAKRTLGYGDIVKAFNRILDDFKPDVVHLNNIHSYLSPRIAQIASKRGVKVVWTLHDYKLVCPSYVCARNGVSCEACFTNKFNVVKNKCMKGKLSASILAYVEALRWGRETLEACTDTFICPSSYMLSKMIAAGFSADKLTVNCNFASNEKAMLSADCKTERDDYCCYVGRLSEEKGVKTLLEAASKLPCRLIVAGDGPLMPSKDIDNVTFLGKIDSVEVIKLLQNAKFSILPSECYENNPLSVIESLQLGTPVVGAHIGGIPELIDDGQTGLTFESGNCDSLITAVNNAYNMSWNYSDIVLSSRKRFSSEKHYENLIKIYNS